jgi:uncharacterized protein
MESTHTALITGATSGIGLELATIFAKSGISLALIARNKTDLEKIKVTLEKVYNVEVFIYICDLAKPDCAQQVYEVMSNEGIEIDYLVNNAGFGDYGDFVDSDAGKNYDMMMLNMITLTEMTHLFLPAMKEKGYGRILNVASTAAFQPGPLMSVYFATKAYVLSFSEGLSQELSGSGVTVTSLCPGPTETNFQKGAKMESSKLLKIVNLMDPQIVAQAGYEAMNDGDVIIIPGFANKLFVMLIRFIPRFLVRKIIYSIQKKV